MELQNGSLLPGPPKSTAGVRSVTIPSRVAHELANHLDSFVADEPDTLLFTSITGKPLRRSAFQRLSGWTHAVTELGEPGLHFHDLRHTGNTLAADTGASTKNLMARMGHDDEKAALRYQHRSKDADRAIADKLNDLLGANTPVGADRETRDSILLERLVRLVAEHRETGDRTQ